MNRIDFDYFFPPDFFKKDVNEKIQTDFLLRALKAEHYSKGDPLKDEPDICIDGKYIELTLASDKNKSIDYINKIRLGTFSANKLEDISISCIEDACFKKSQKKYFCNHKRLNVLLTIPIYFWTWKAYSNIPELVPNSKLDYLMSKIKNDYIDNRIFDDVYIMMPGFRYDWLVYSCKDNLLLNHIFLNDLEIKSHKYPYIIKTN